MDFEQAARSRRSIRRWTDEHVDTKLVEKILSYATYAPTPCNQQLWQFVVVTDDHIKDRLVKEAYSSTIIRRAPVVIAVMYDGWSYKEAIQSASLAVQNILLAATNFGVGSLAMNSYGADTRIKKILNIPERYTICCFVCLGYATDVYKTTPAVPRRPVSEIMHLNKYKGSDASSLSYDPMQWTLRDIKDYQQYYCRKTFLGKEMDITNHYEKDLVKKLLRNVQGPVVDIMSYDGAYLPLFPDVPITGVDLTPATEAYTKAALGERTLSHALYDPDKKSFTDDAVPLVTMIYKAERLPPKDLSRMLKQGHAQLSSGGEMLIISRRSSLFYNMFYSLIRKLFGDDIRKTGIFAFFGPYKPVSSSNLKRQLNKAGFKNIKEDRYFWIPPFFDQAYQMYLQYKRSEGSSYLHRMRRENWLSRTISFFLKLQGISRHPFGSISVFRAKK